MRKLFAAAILSAGLIGANARADDAPNTMPVGGMPVDGPRQVMMLVQNNGGADTTQPAGVNPQPRIFRSIRVGGAGGGGGFGGGNVTYQFRAAGQTEKAAWMGVATSHPPLALLKQLKIKSGLVVDEVKAGSPADTAGLKPQDIIEKLDDQILINPSQLEGLVRMHNPGDSVTLTILHEGTRGTLTAKLAEHDVLVMPDAAVPLSIDPAAAFPAPGMTTPGALPLQPGAPVPPVPVAPDGFPGNVFVTPGATAHVEVTTTGQNGQATSFESQFSDGTNQLTIVRRDNKKILTIKDAQGKQQFEGPVDTAEQQQAIPRDLLPKFREMQKMANMTDDSPKP